MGLDVNTLQTIITLSGSRGQEVHLTAAEVLRMLDDYSTRAQEHLTQWFQTEPPLPVTEHQRASTPVYWISPLFESDTSATNGGPPELKVT